MDPSVVKALAEAIGPVLGVLACGAIPASIIFLIKHFKLKTRELELEAELHGRDAQARLQAMETRLAALEGALGSLVQTLSRRPELSAGEQQERGDPDGDRDRQQSLENPGGPVRHRLLK
jgi:hypothetical protein